MDGRFVTGPRSCVTDALSHVVDAVPIVDFNTGLDSVNETSAYRVGQATERISRYPEAPEAALTSMALTSTSTRSSGVRRHGGTRYLPFLPGSKNATGTSALIRHAEPVTA